MKKIILVVFAFLSLLLLAGCVSGPLENDGVEVGVGSLGYLKIGDPYEETPSFFWIYFEEGPAQIYSDEQIYTIWLYESGTLRVILKDGYQSIWFGDYRAFYWREN